jgi:hypothetical protein
MSIFLKICSILAQSLINDENIVVAIKRVKEKCGLDL